MGRKGKGELCTNVRNMIVKACRENRKTLELKRTLGISRSTIRSIVKKMKKKSVENQQGKGRKTVYTDRDKNKLTDNLQRYNWYC